MASSSVVRAGTDLLSKGRGEQVNLSVYRNWCCYLSFAVFRTLSQPAMYARGDDTCRDTVKLCWVSKNPDRLSHLLQKLQCLQLRAATCTFLRSEGRVKVPMAARWQRAAAPSQGLSQGVQGFGGFFRAGGALALARSP